MVAFRPTFSFSSDFGGFGRCAQLQQKSQSRSLHLSGRQFRPFSISKAGMPGRPSLFYQVAHQQQLPVSQGTHPYPLLCSNQVIGAAAIQSHVLFEKPEHVLNGEPPQVHLAQLLQKDTGWSSPEQPHGLFVAGLPIRLQEFDPQHHDNQFRQFLEMQPFPGLNANGLRAEQEGFGAIGWTRRA